MKRTTANGKGKMKIVHFTILYPYFIRFYYQFGTKKFSLFEFRVLTYVCICLLSIRKMYNFQFFVFFFCCFSSFMLRFIFNCTKNHYCRVFFLLRIVFCSKNYQTRESISQLIHEAHIYMNYIRMRRRRRRKKTFILFIPSLMCSFSYVCFFNLTLP